MYESCYITLCLCMRAVCETRRSNVQKANVGQRHRNRLRESLQRDQPARPPRKPFYGQYCTQFHLYSLLPCSLPNLYSFFIQLYLQFIEKDQNTIKFLSNWSCFDANILILIQLFKENLFKKLCLISFISKGKRLRLLRFDYNKGHLNSELLCSGQMSNCLALCARDRSRLEARRQSASSRDPAITSDDL